MVKKNEELALSANNQEQINYIKALTGEATMPKGIQWVSFNGNEGKFFQGTGDNKIEIGDSINGTIVKITALVETAYQSRNKNGKVKSRELRSIGKNDFIDLYDSITGEFVENIEYAKAKDKYDLSFRQILYISLDEMGGEVVKMRVGGASLRELWAYLSSFGRDTVIRFKTKFFAEQFKNEARNDFFKIKFERGEELDAKTTQVMLNHLSSINVEPVKKAEKFIESSDEITIIE